MRLHIVSDLHIDGADDPLYGSLLALLASAGPGDTVVLAGDIFDVFVGNKALFKRRYHLFFEAVQAGAARGVRLEYIEGNHDFLLRGAFRGLSGASVHAREVSLEFGGKRFHFSHGDLADASDTGYRLLRFLFRSPLMWAFVLLTPGTWLDRIGASSSRYSRSKKPSLPEDGSPGRRDQLRTVCRNYAVTQFARGHDFVVMGHFHDIDEMEFLVQERPCQYVNVGFPRRHGTFLTWSPESAKILRQILPKSG